MKAPLAAVAAFAAVAASLVAVGSATSAPKQGCATPVFQNGLELVFARAKTRAGADAMTAKAAHMGFKGMETVQESCSVWKSVLRGIDAYDAAVGVQTEARRVKLFPTIECTVAEEIGQYQVLFGTRASQAELREVIQRANNFGYIGIKTKPAPCGGYTAYLTGFRDLGQAQAYAKEASDRTGLKVVGVKV